MKFNLIFILSALLMFASCSDQQSSNNIAGTKADYVLAFSWQPAFCETASRKRECKIQTSQRFDANHFTLHGLWPQPGNNIYCGVDETQVQIDKKGRWSKLNVPRVSESLWAKLKQSMPGTMSSLHKHEWVKHGTCYDKSIEKYYEDSLWLLKQLNASKLQNLFQTNIGNQVTGDQIRNALEESFGKGAGDRLRISCKIDQNSGRQLITELTLGFSGEIEPSKDIANLIAASAVTKPGCPRGIIDAVGLQ